MTKIEKKKNEWEKAINQVVSDKHVYIKEEIIEYISFLDKKYNADIDITITKIPDLRFLTNIGRRGQFFIIRKSYEMHFYLKNPKKIMNKYSFIKAKSSPANHYKFVGRDAPEVSTSDLTKIIHESFCYVSDITILNEDQYKDNRHEQNQKDSLYIISKDDVEIAFNTLKRKNKTPTLDSVMNIIEKKYESKGALPPDWKVHLQKGVEKWFPVS
jgi:hypothetical protein